MGFFSEALLEMDRNTVQYMIDERNKENEELKKENEELQSQKEELQSQNNKLQSQNNELIAKLNFFEKQLTEQGEVIRKLQEKI